MLGNNDGGMVTNLPWAFYQPTLTAPPCNPSTEEAYGGRCFALNPALDTLVQTFSDSTPNRIVTGILIMTPSWARLPCSKPSAEHVWCGTAPGYVAEFGTFAAYLAHRYNGLNGHGRVANFVIHNEVNAPWAYYTNSCGEPQPNPYPLTCSVSAQVSRYAADYNAAYDGIKSEQAAAKVLVSMTGYFNGADNPNPGGQITLKTYLSTLVPLVGARQLQMALHAYNQNGNVTAINPDDDIVASIGAIGKVTGWLRQAFPTRPAIWEVHLTEQGLKADLAHDQDQADALCQAFKNVLGTPGVESFHYTPPTSHDGYAGEELVWCQRLQGPPWDAGPVGYCNLSSFGTTWRWRQAWATWALANRNDINPAILNCGFEVLPYVKFSRYASPRGHIATTRMPPPGATLEYSWKLLRSQAPGTHLLYECRVDSGSVYVPGGHSFIDAVNPCPSYLTPWGPLGYAYDSPGAGRVAINRCYVNAPGYEDHFLSTSTGCEGWIYEETLGYAPPF
jgi:hypothetical protein